jgi:TRAP-type mannitol/chloroaromatic compound transport system substrate-binding protein
MLQSFHQCAEQLEVIVNRARHDALPSALPTLLAVAVDAASADFSWKLLDRASRDYLELQAAGRVKFYKMPDAILQRQLDAYDQIAARKAAANPLFKEIAESQRALAPRVVRFDMDNSVNRRLAFDHYFAPMPPRPKRT